MRNPIKLLRERKAEKERRKTDYLFAMAYMHTGNQRFWDGISTIPKRPDGKSWGDTDD